jgi:CubicO group peptidase (beta-lactamase class C family)
MTTKNFTSSFQPLLVAFTVVAILFSITAKAQLNKQFSDTLNKLMELRVQQLNMKGVSAAIVFPDNSVWEHTVGYAGTKKLNTDMLFEMGSNTKTFTMALILLLEEEGKLSIDDTIYKYLSPIKNITNGITIKQLLYHTSGIYNYTNNSNFLEEVNNGDPSKIIEVDSILKNYVAEKVDDPGKQWRYSNTNFILLGKIIEKVASKPYHVVMREKLLDPLGLKHTYLAEYENHTEEKAEAWLLTQNGNVEYENIRYRNFLSAAWAAGGIISTAEDLAQWAKLLYSNKVFNKSESYKKMTTLLNINGTQYQFGLSTFFSFYRGNLYVGHGGTTLQHSEMEFAPKLNYSFVGVSNEQGTSQELVALKRSIYDLMEAELPLALSTKKTTKPQFKVYPNPSNNIINIAIENPMDKHIIKVFDLSGKLIQQFESSATAQLNKANFGEGIFIVEVNNTDKNTLAHQRIVFY